MDGTINVTLSEAKSVINSMAGSESILLLSSPGIGKSEMVEEAAKEAGLECKSLLGTQIAPEDVSGIPTVSENRTVFCPPRILLPEEKNAKPFCLFLDELPACTPDIQKAFYSLLQERRIGEFSLPKGTWVVAAGNRVEDRALVRTLSSALINRVFILNIRVDFKEWMQWAKRNNIRQEILSFIVFCREALCRPVPKLPAPFSTPRAWASLSRAMDLVEKNGRLTPKILTALAYGRVSPEDAAVFSVFLTEKIDGLQPWDFYFKNPKSIPADPTYRWFIFQSIYAALVALCDKKRIPDKCQIKKFMEALSPEEKNVMLVRDIDLWGKLGLDAEILKFVEESLGINANNE